MVTDHTQGQGQDLGQDQFHGHRRQDMSDLPDVQNDLVEGIETKTMTEKGIGIIIGKGSVTGNEKADCVTGIETEIGIRPGTEEVETGILIGAGIEGPIDLTEAEIGIVVQNVTGAVIGTETGNGIETETASVAPLETSHEGMREEVNLDTRMPQRYMNLRR